MINQELNNWQKYPENKPTDTTADFIVAIYNPNVSRKHNTTAPAYCQVRAMWLSDSFMSLEGDNYFKNNEVAYFLQLPPILTNPTYSREVIEKEGFIKIATFYNEGIEWGAYNYAVKFCEDWNLSVGIAQRDAPTALYNDNSIVSKWKNLSEKDKEDMFGFIECQDKRSGNASVWKK